MFVYLNGKFVPQNKAAVSVSDHGFLYGDGVYETIGVTEGHPRFLPEHLRRLAHSARALELKIPLSLSRLAFVIAALIRKNKLQDGEASVRATLTRGPGPYGFDPRPCRHPTLVVTALPFGGYPPSYYKEGLRVALVSVRRNSVAALPPSIKSTSCLNGILAKMESLRSKCQEGVMLSENGFVAEGTVSNVFALKKGVVLTPRLDGGLLPGVTREAVLKVARAAGYKTVEKHLKPAELLAADEIFLTSSLMNIMPVSQVWWRGKKAFQADRFPATNHIAAVFAKLPNHVR